jgi:hypothetical protein
MRLGPLSRRPGIAYLRRRMPRRLLALALVTAVALSTSGGCSRSSDRDLRAKALAAAPGGAQARAVDLERPLEALRLSADDAAARAGSFAWEAQVSWTVARPGATPVHLVERHRVRQLASGEFEVSADLDPGAGPGSETGKQVVYAGGMTYARGKWAPFRERPTDRGRGARRARDESFRMAADLADLYGPALSAEPSGEVSYLGRRARRFVLSLTSAPPPKPRPPPPALPDGRYDDATRKRLDFLDGRVPTALSGELLLDAATGVPLSVSLRGAFSQQSDPQLRADVELDAAVRALGGDVPAVKPPRGALADERKPKGVARALEAAGLRQRDAGAAGAEEEAAQPDE